jgi:hypothetical protein
MSHLCPKHDRIDRSMSIKSEINDTTLLWDNDSALPERIEYRKFFNAILI